MFWALDIRFDDHRKMLVLSENDLEVMIDDVWKLCFLWFYTLVIEKHLNTTTTNFTPTSKVSKLLQNMFHVLGVKLVFWNCFQILSKGSTIKNSNRFPRGVPKEEIQQCQQARWRPEEKETLKTCWVKQIVAVWIWNSSRRPTCTLHFTFSEEAEWYILLFFPLAS